MSGAHHHDHSHSHSRDPNASMNMRAAIASVSIALFLIGLKTYAALETGSIAMLGSLADTGLDLVASLVTLYGVRLAALPADPEHRFGHGKAEALAALFQVALIAFSAFGIGWRAIARLMSGERTANPEYGIAVSLIAIGTTFALLFYQRHVIRTTGSVAIEADHVHYQTDVLLNLSVIAALVLDNILGVSGADPLFGVGIALWLGWGAWKASSRAIDQLMDREWPEEKRQRILELAAASPDLRGIHDLRTRSSGAHDFVQFHICVDPLMTVARAHEIIEEVERRLKAEFPGADILIHLDPVGKVDRPGNMLVETDLMPKQENEMISIPLIQVDAFADEPFTGNPAAVCPLQEWLPDELLQAIAMENNLSETAFTVPASDDDADYELRWFTPTTEVAMCGHATLASGHALMKGDRIRFRTRKAGILEVARAGDAYRMTLPVWTPEARPLPRSVAALGCRAIETLWHPEKYALVVVETEEEVRSLQPDFRALREEGDVLTIVTAPGRETDIVSRVFAAGAGIDEDPVTGSAHAVLTPYWSHRLNRTHFTAYQASRRGGYIDCTLSGGRVILGGKCVTMIEGILRI